jgi:hypothetical protein
MNLIDLTDRAKAWVCDPISWAIYSEEHKELEG